MRNEIWRPCEESAVAELYRRTNEAPDALAVCFLDAHGQPEKAWSREKLWRASGACAAELERHGLKPGEVCALLFPYCSDFAGWYWGVVRLGSIPAVLACPSARLHPEKFCSGLEGMARHSGLDVMVTGSEMHPKIEPLLSGGSVRTVVAADKIPELSDAWPDSKMFHASPESALLLQHSSGTTGLQKAVALSNRAVLGQLGALAEALSLHPQSDRIVSWLPLYHDMGLIAAWLLPFLSGTLHIQMSPLHWVARPELFLRALSDFKGTLAWLPNFAYSHTASRARRENLSGIELSHVRRLINCSEPVRASSHDQFLNAVRSTGLKPECLCASYALAENVFAVTQSAEGHPPLCLNVDLETLQTFGKVEVATTTTEKSTRAIVSSGKVIRGSEVAVWDDGGTTLSDGCVGELVIRSEYLFDGYRRERQTQPMHDGEGWFRTGDMGFLLNGELFVVGRKKDLLIVRGRNIYPEDIEDCVSAVPGVYSGRVVAYGEYVESLGTEMPALLLEVQNEVIDRKELELKIRSAVQSVLELQLLSITFVPHRWLVKSSSGKMARQTNVERWKKLQTEQHAPCEPVASTGK